MDLKALCSKLTVQGRKDDLADRVCLALGISKSGSSGETDIKSYSCSAFDTNTCQQYLGLGKLSAASGEWSADLASMPTSFSMDSIKNYLIYSPDKTWAMRSENVPSGEKFENIFAFFVLNWIWGMRKCSKTDLQVMIVCQNYI